MSEDSAMINASVSREKDEYSFCQKCANLKKVK